MKSIEREAERTFRGGRDPALDGLRAIAVIGVIFFHAYQGQSFWTWSFVDLFFVLSGYLITDILVRGVGTPRFLRNFLARRILRIWPVYYLTLIGIFVFTNLHLFGVRLHVEHGAYLRSMFFVQFTGQYVHHRPLAEVIGNYVPWFSHSWSLAVEEQFYVLWPLVVLSLRKRPRALVNVCVAFVCTSIVLRWLGVPGYILFARMDGLALGAMLAVLMANKELLRITEATVERLAKIALVLATPGIAAYLLLGYAGKIGSPPPDIDWHPWVITSFALAYFGIVALLVCQRFAAGRAVLSKQPLPQLGLISYAVYLFHLPVIQVVVNAGLSTHRFGRTAAIWIAIPLTFLAAQISRVAVEAPILSLKRYFPMRPAPAVEALPSTEGRGTLSDDSDEARRS